MCEPIIKCRRANGLQTCHVMRKQWNIAELTQVAMNIINLKGASLNTLVLDAVISISHFPFCWFSVITQALLQSLTFIEYAYNICTQSMLKCCASAVKWELFQNTRTKLP